MPIDPQIQGFLTEHNKKPVSYATLTPEQARKNAETLLTDTCHIDVERVQDTITDDARKVPLRIYTPKGQSAKTLPVLVYFHGGGFVTAKLVAAGSVDDFDGVCRALTAKSGVIVASVQYKLSPEHKFPEGLEDAHAAVKWVAHNAASFGADAEQLAVGGDSAGGNLAAVVSVLARDRSGPSIKLQLLLYPLVMYEDEEIGYSESAKQNSYGNFLDLDKLAWYFKQYVVNPTKDALNPLISVLLTQDLSQLPPAVVLTAEYDILNDQGHRFAEKLKEAGVQVYYKDYPGQIHSFVRFAVTSNKTDAGLQAIHDIAHHIHSAFGLAN